MTHSVSNRNDCAWLCQMDPLCTAFNVIISSPGSDVFSCEPKGIPLEVLINLGLPNNENSGSTVFIDATLLTAAQVRLFNYNPEYKLNL